MDAEKLETFYPRPNPYVGPRAFRMGEALYGRDREANELLDLLIAERIVLLYSPSGAGKSSLVQAALLPRLREESFHIHPIIRVNQDPPAEFAGLPQFNRYVFSALLSLDSAHPVAEQRPAAELAVTSLPDYLKAHPPQTPEMTGEVLVFDQFEEILTTNPADHEAKEEFFSQVGQTLRKRERWALFAMREDFIAGIEPFLRAIPSRLANNFRLDMLRAEAALDAIRRPAQAAGVDFTEAAAQRLVNDLRRMQVQKPDGVTIEEVGPYVEPVQLQVVCRRLWGKVGMHTTAITEEAVDSVGDVDNALAAYYAERVALAAKNIGISEYFIRSWVNRYLITEQGIRGQVLMRREASEGLDNRVIRLLQDAHLVRSEQRRGATWFELAHDRLLQPVRQNNNEWFNINLSTLQRQANRWERENRPAHLLLHDEGLANAEKWAAENAKVMTPLDREYLDACQKAQRIKEEERQRDEERFKLESAQKLAQAERLRAEEQADAAARYKKQSRFLQGALVFAVILALIAFLAGSQALYQRQVAASLLITAEYNGSLAEAANTEAFANQVTAFAASTKAVANQMTAQANQAEAENNEQRALQAQQAAQNAERTAVAASTSAVQEKAVALTAQAEAEYQSAVAYSRQLANQALSKVDSDPDVALLVGIEAYRVAETDEAKQALATALDAKLGRTTALITSPPNQAFFIYSLAFSPNGKLLAIGGSDGTLLWWDMTTQKVVKLYPRIHNGRLFALAFSPDGKWLASGGEGEQAFLWDVASAQQVKKFTVGGGATLSLSFSTDSVHLAASRTDNVIQVIDVRNGSAVRWVDGVAGHTDDIWALAYSPDGKWLASGGADGQVRLWDVTTGDVVFSPPKTHKDLVRTIAWAPDSKTFASGSRDKTILVWDVAKRAVAGDPLTGHAQEVLSLAYSYDGRMLASGSSDESIILWDSFTHNIIVQLRTQKHTIRAVVFSPVENILASGSFNKTVLLQRVNVPTNSELDLVERACLAAGRNLNYEEWLQFFQGEPHRKTCEQWLLVTLTPTPN